MDGWFAGKGNAFLDVGELYEKIASHQIEEMKTIDTPSFIRVSRGLYDGGTNQNGQQVINRIETRFIVLPDDEDMERFPELEAKELEELKEDFSLLSNKIVLGITGDEGKIMEKFINQLNSLNKKSSPKK